MRAYYLSYRAPFFLYTPLYKRDSILHNKEAMFLFLLLPIAFVFADIIYKAGVIPLELEVAPPKPHWPAEWAAEIIIKNHTTNSTKFFRPVRILNERF